MKIPPIISENIRVRLPDSFEVGEGSVVDDYSYFSVRVRVGRFAHIASCVTIGGGGRYEFSLGDFSSISAGCRIWCASEDFRTDMAGIVPSGMDVGKKLIEGDVRVGQLCIVGSNSVVMPDNDIPTGVAIGALSFVPPGFAFEPWSVYAGVPLRRIGERERSQVERQAHALLAGLDGSSELAEHHEQ